VRRGSVLPAHGIVSRHGMAPKALMPLVSRFEGRIHQSVEVVFTAIHTSASITSAPLSLLCDLRSSQMIGLTQLCLGMTVTGHAPSLELKLESKNQVANVQGDRFFPFTSCTKQAWNTLRQLGSPQAYDRALLHYQLDATRVALFRGCSRSNHANDLLVAAQVLGGVIAPYLYATSRWVVPLFSFDLYR
jgi:hypothetical protein